ncbi:hypothetical protein Brms1b_003110 [Colletotrichum noveboracense]|nr:hypothetical protein Brms1b_003110 [Colletotrichum noveboracense]
MASTPRASSNLGDRKPAKPIIRLWFKENGITAHIVMPSTTRPHKIDATKGYGANVVVCGPKDREAVAAKIVSETGARLVPPFDHPDVILGQATVGLEMHDQIESLDAVIAPCSGGGLLSGVALSCEETGVKVFGAEPEFEGADDGRRGYYSGKRVTQVSTRTIADGLIGVVGARPWNIIYERRLVSGMYAVSEEEIWEATKLILERLKLVVEPAAAVPLAVALFNEEFRVMVEEEAGEKGWDLGLVLSGGNIGVDGLAKLFSLGVESGPVRSPFPSISGFRNTTSVPVSTFISITPTPVSSSVAATSSAPATVTVSNGETVAVAAGVVVVGAGIGGFFTVNGVTTPIAGGASVVAGSSAANPGDPSNPDDPDKPKSNDGDIATNSGPASVPASSAPPVSATSSDIPFSSTSSSAVPTGTGVDYMIFAKENTVKEDADGFGNTLAGLVGADNIDNIVNDAGFPYAWRANLNPDQLEKVKNDRVIAGTDINDPLTRDDDQPAGAQPSATQQKRAEVTQTPIAKNDIFDLRVLSTPPREKEALPNYRYDDFAGQGITIYVVDTGPFDLQHEEFRAPSPGITRRELNVARNKKFTLEDTQHGTCVASKTVGGTTGAAKRANLVGVRIDFTEFGLLRGLQSAANEIKQKGLKGKAVVTTSILMRAPDAIYTTSFRSVMRSFVALDVPIVAAAGNKFLDGLTEPDKLPATMAKDFPVIVVGNAGKDFKIAPKSQRGNLVTTYAIGADIKCADPLDLTGLATDSGTSFAAPQVAQPPRNISPAWHGLLVPC